MFCYVALLCALGGEGVLKGGDLCGEGVEEDA